MKYIVEIPSGREADLRTLVGAVNRGGDEAGMTRIAQDAMGRTAELVWVEQFYEGELRAELPGIEPWAELAEETREGIGEVMAGLVAWQFHETHPLDSGAAAQRVMEEYPEITAVPGGSRGLLETGLVRAPNLGGLLESVAEIVTGEPAPRGEMVRNGTALRILEAVPALRRELVRSRRDMTLPDDVLPGILDAMSDEAHRIARKLGPQDVQAVMEAAGKPGGETPATPPPGEYIVHLTVQDVIDQYRDVTAGGDAVFPDWEDLPLDERARLIDNCRRAMPRNPGAIIRNALMDNPPAMGREAGEDGG